MNDILQTAYGGAFSAQRNRVLRNTYWLLALSMVPTVAGAWLGVAMGFAGFTGRPFMDFMLFMGLAFGFFYAIERTKNSGWGVALLLGFTFFMGLMLSRLIGAVLGSYSNGASLIMTAFGGTGLVFAGMATMASTIKRDLSGMSRWLFAGLLVVLVAGVANIWLQMPALFLAVSVICIALFSAYLLYDLKRVIDGGETNYVTATLAVYLDVYNIFTSLLSLLGFVGGERD
ncbi:MAG: Bax inhibitor-1/YccA family protein [Burkholderiales bacterium]|nr:Bax inhibitor-1/YccA family protein [Burkholderiales bacterium]